MELNLMALGAALAMQVTLAPCTIEGVAGPARCGSYKVWEDRAAKAGRQIELSIIVLSSLEAARSDPDKCRNSRFRPRLTIRRGDVLSPE